MIKTPNQIFLEVSFDVVRYHLHAVVNMIVFALIELLLDEGCQFLIVVLTVLCISRTPTFSKWLIEFSLEPEKFIRTRQSCIRNILALFS